MQCGAALAETLSRSQAAAARIEIEAGWLLAADVLTAGGLAAGGAVQCGAVRCGRRDGEGGKRKKERRGKAATLVGRAHPPAGVQG